MKLQLLTPILVIFLGCSTGSPKRIKRIINGDVWKGRPSTYNAIQYYGAITTAHNVWTFGKVFDFLKNIGSYGQISCSGSLLTPAIFQTACHCVAIFDIRAESFSKPATVTHHWEGRKVVYLGVSNRFGEDSMVTSNFVLTEKFLIDDKCTGLGGGNLISYDYALIQISSDFLHYETYKYNWLEIRYAPQYTIEDITEFHEYALKKQLVCLMLGFGIFDDGKDGGKPSDVLRHAWNNLLSYSNCFRESEFVNRVRIDPLIQNWVCTQPFPEHNQWSGRGDSGGPLSCSNRYFGVLSAVRTQRRTYGTTMQNHLNLYHPLIESLFTNTVNYRYKLLYVIFRLQDKYESTGMLHIPPGERDSSEKIMSVKSQTPKFAIQNSFQLTSSGLKLQPEKFAVPLVLVVLTIFN